MKELNFSRPFPSEDDVEKKPRKERSKGSKMVPTVRTFGKDVESMMRDEHITKTQVIMAEEERREARGEERTVHDEDAHLNKVIVGLVLILMLGLGIGAYVLIGGSSSKSTGAEGEEVAKTERMVEIAIAGSPREQILADLAEAYSKTSFTPNESRIIAFTTTEGGKSRDATAPEALTAITGGQAPEGLLRSLSHAITLTVEGKKISDPLIGYITLSSRSYPNTASEMLDWEPSMAEDLLLVLDPKFPRGQLAELRERAWDTERIQGIDARVLKNALGEVVLAYALQNKTQLFIAGNDEVLRSALSLFNERNLGKQSSPE